MSRGKLYSIYRRFFLCLACAFIIPLAVITLSPRVTYAASKTLSSLFGYQPIRLTDTQSKNFNTWLNWQRVQREMQDDTLDDPFGHMPAPLMHQWNEVRKIYPTLQPLEQARLVSGFFNLWPSKNDIDEYGTEEYWASPREFIAHYGGDCEDYAIIKYKALELLGWPTDKMWVVLVQENELRRGHAVLAVMIDGSVYIFDNLSMPRDLGLEQSKYKGHYTPYYACNANGIWRFIPMTDDKVRSGDAPEAITTTRPLSPKR